MIWIWTMRYNKIRAWFVVHTMVHHNHLKPWPNKQTLFGKHLRFFLHGMFVCLATHDKHDKHWYSSQLAKAYQQIYLRVNVCQTKFSRWPNTQTLTNIVWQAEFACLCFWNFSKTCFACDQAWWPNWQTFCLTNKILNVCQPMFVRLARA